MFLSRDEEERVLCMFAMTKGSGRPKLMNSWHVDGTNFISEVLP